MADAQLEALSVETRRAIYRLLLERPRSVGELADEMPVSRPAVSQHLKILVESGLASVQTMGTRRVYKADPQGMADLRDWVDQMWELALGRFVRLADDQNEGDDMAETTTQIEPVRKEVLVPGAPEEVFRVFTERIDEWWPKQSHSVAGEDAARVVVDGRVGGRIYEVTNTGVQHDWGEISVWEPGSRIEMTWHPGVDAEQTTQLTIDFAADGGRTKVTLLHDGWAARGVNGPETRDGYDIGWDLVLGMIPGARASR